MAKPNMFSGIIEQNLPILIAGPTASGKSALGLRLAKECNGAIINADALQIYSDWRILTARPSIQEEALAPHHLYGHVGLTQRYSVGHWLAEVKQVLGQLKSDGLRPIILGGTGLYFTSLTKGLVDIPPIDPSIRQEANELIENHGKQIFAVQLEKDDAKTAELIDMRNPARTQRAWEVLKTTGIGLADWQERTPPPLLAKDACHKLLLDCDVEWLNERIDRRFDIMIEQGALTECEHVLQNGWDAALPSCQAIGAKELIDHIEGHLSLDEAKVAGKLQTRQYGKRQRTWFRSKMNDWRSINPKTL